MICDKCGVDHVQNNLTTIRSSSEAVCYGLPDNRLGYYYKCRHEKELQVTLGGDI